jgi:hypothetical protein
MAFICRFLPFSIWCPFGRLDPDRHIDAALSQNGEAGAFQRVQTCTANVSDQTSFLKEAETGFATAT